MKELKGVLPILDKTLKGRHDMFRKTNTTKLYGATVISATLLAFVPLSSYAKNNISVLLFSGPFASYTQQHLESFTKETGVKVNLTIIGGEVINNKTSTELLGNNTSFDVISIRGESIPFYGIKKVLENLEPYLQDPKTNSASYKLDMVAGPVLNYYKWKGEQLGLPWQVATNVTFYRKDLVKAAGFDGPPRTAEDYLEYAKKMNTPPTVYGTGLMMQKSHNLMTDYYQWLLTFGGDIFDSNGKVILDSNEARASLKYWLSLKQYAPPAVTNWAYERLTTALAQGNVAMGIQWTDAAPFMFDPKGSKVADVIGFAPAPVAKRPAAIVGGWGLSMPAISKNKAEAFEFIKWATGPAMARGMAELGGTPSRSDLLADKALDAKYPWFAAHAEAAKVATARPRMVTWPAVSDALETILAKAATGALSVDEAVTQMAKQATELTAH